MPSYELNLIVRKLPRTALVDCLKRIGTNILDGESNVLRKIEYLANRTPPYNLSDPTKRGIQRTWNGSYFIYHFDGPIPEYHRIKGDLKMNTDIVKATFIRRDDPKVTAEYECSLEEELLPPATRPSIKKLIDQGRKGHTIQVINADKSPLTD